MGEITPLDKLIDMLEDLDVRKFYGEILLKYEAGRIVVVKKTESIKLS